MSSIVKCKVNGHVYLYESKSYRDKQGSPRNIRKFIGKIDSETGEPIYTATYLEQMNNTGKPIINTNIKNYSINDIKHSQVKEFGATYLLKCIAEKIGLLNILQETFPDNWKQIFSIACFLISNDEPVMYCEDWIERVDNLSPVSISAPSISRLFKSINYEKRLKFFEKWSLYRQENEFLALDITSVSSYSELISDVEWGYNRDKEKLAQINLCLILGEKTKLPIFQTVYSGSLTDVSTLNTTLKLTEFLEISRMLVVMDKGFYSQTNVDNLISNHTGYKFLLAMPFSSIFAKNQVEYVRKYIDQAKNTICIGEDTVLGVTTEANWDSKNKLFVHVYYNPVMASLAKSELYSEVKQLENNAKLEPESKGKLIQYMKYLNIICINKKASEYAINIKQEILDKELLYSGWLVIISNHVDNAAEALYIYRAKDVVEKGFSKLKNNLELNRLRVHSSDSMQNKVFVSFIALIIMSHIHTIMLENDFYSKMSMKKLIHILEKLKTHYIKGERILYPITKEQKTIYKAFGLREPQ